MSTRISEIEVHNDTAVGCSIRVDTESLSTSSTQRDLLFRIEQDDQFVVLTLRGLQSLEWAARMLKDDLVAWQNKGDAP